MDLAPWRGRVIHWKRAFKSAKTWCRTVPMVALLLAMAPGCGPRPSSPSAGDAGAKAAATKSPKKPETPPISVSVTRPEITLLDPKSPGAIAAEVKAASGAAGPNGEEGGAVGVLQKLSATLYRDGKPAATLTADRGTVDEKTATVTGTGNVVLRSLMHAGSPTIRADTMTWRHADNKIRGEGSVLITREPGLRVPGRSFVADTAVHRFTVQGNGVPATGTP